MAAKKKKKVKTFNFVFQRNHVGRKLFLCIICIVLLYIYVALHSYHYYESRGRFTTYKGIKFKSERLLN